LDLGPVLGLIWDIAQLVFALAGVAVVLFLCYWFSKYMAKKMNHMSKGNNMKIVERIALTQDKGLVIMELCGHYYLVGFAANTIEILKELDGSDLILQQTGQASDFLNVLNSTIKSRWDMKTRDKKHQNGVSEEDTQSENKE
jgi:flagellar biogenesis protein FliO